ncbi:Immunoglobulin I-set domain containing protein, partial [Euroglyphus maynei]
MTLHCITLHGNPKQLQTVHWYRNGQHFLTTISFRKLQSSSSQPIPTSSTTTPSFLQHSFYHRIGTGKHFTLVDESTPLAGPLNGQFLLTPNGTSWLNMAEPYVHYLNEPEMLIIANVTREHRGNYSCLGFNGAANGSQLSNEKTISVKSSLMLTSNSDTNDRYVLKGSQAVLECRIDDPGDPPAHSIVWTHNGVRIDRATTHFQSPPMTGNSIQRNSVIARYRTPKADMTTSGEYRCRAINDLGQGEWGTFRLDVKSPPRILQSLPATIGALSDQNLTLTCRVECQPPCEIHWFHNNLTRLSPDTRGILPSSLLTNEYRAKLRNGNEMTFSLINEQTEGVQIPAHTWSSITIHNTSVLFDFDQLTCVSSNSDNEELGPPVHSTVVFRRE